jgi:hypothetical protein
MSLDRPIARPISAALARPMTGQAVGGLVLDPFLTEDHPGATAAYTTIRVDIPTPPALFDDHPGAVAGYQLGGADLLSRHGGALTAYILHS